MSTTLSFCAMEEHGKGTKTTTKERERSVILAYVACYASAGQRRCTSEVLSISNALEGWPKQSQRRVSFALAVHVHQPADFLDREGREHIRATT